MTGWPSWTGGEIIALDTPAGLFRGLASDSVVEFTAESAAESGVSSASGGEGSEADPENGRGPSSSSTDRLEDTLSGLMTWAGLRSGGWP